MKAFRGILGVVISAVVIWLLITRTGIEWGKAWELTREADLLLLVISGLVVNLMFPLRALRWRPILWAVKPDIPFLPLWRATAIGMMANTLLPFRMGELARAYVLSREERDVPFPASVASLFVDRIFDGVVVVMLLVIALFLPDMPADATIAGQPLTTLAVFPAIGAVAGLVVLYLLAIYPAAAIRIVTVMTGVLTPAARAMVVNVVTRFTDGLGALRTPGQFAAVYLWTTAHWLAQPLAFYIGFMAFGIDAPFAAALIAQFTIVVAVALPSTPGYVGLYEAGAAAGLLLFGVDGNRALAWAIAMHVLSLVPITLIGLFYLNRIGLRMGELRQSSAPGNA